MHYTYAMQHTYGRDSSSAHHPKHQAMQLILKQEAIHHHY